MSDVPNPYAAPAARLSALASGASEVPAERGQRLAAVIVDTLVGLATYLPLLVGLVISAAGQQDKAETPVALIIGGVVSLACVVGVVVYTIQLVIRNGQTIGKRALAIKVVRLDGSPVGLGRSFWLRNFVPGALGAIPCFGGIISLVDILMIFGEDRRCLHDKIADTKVVRA